MSQSTADDAQLQRQVLEISQWISNEESVPIILLNGTLHFTKTAPEETAALLLRDLPLERSTRQWIGEERFEAIVDRYGARHLAVSGEGEGWKTVEWPRHAPVRIIAGYGAICSGRNIFMFFPEVILGHDQPATDQKDVFGLELVDVWEEVFRQCVEPCYERVFEPDAQLRIAAVTRGVLPEAICLASVFHELGHRVGAWRVSPKNDERIQVKGRLFDAIGELSTDMLAIHALDDFPAVQWFIVLSRIFWFGRKGFAVAPRTAELNQDNDAWTGTFLWNRLLKAEVLARTNGKLTIGEGDLALMAKSICDDLEQLGRDVIAEKGEEAQKRLIGEWMLSQVDGNGPAADPSFGLPRTLIEVFQQCQGIAEVPTFRPPVVLPVGSLTDVALRDVVVSTSLSAEWRRREEEREPGARDMPLRGAGGVEGQELVSSDGQVVFRRLPGTIV